MNITNMHTEFKLLMDKSDAAGAPNFLSLEIDRFLNAAIEKFITKRAFGNNPRRLGFEEDQKRRDDLRELVGTYSISIEDTGEDDDNKPNGVFVELPEDYRHAINEEGTMTIGEVDHRVGIKPITHDRYNKIINDPFNKPNKKSLYRLDVAKAEDSNAGRVEIIIPAGYKLSTYMLRYLKTHVKVDKTDSVDCNLAEHTHREIVRMAVVEALQNVEDPRYQSGKIELNELE